MLELFIVNNGQTAKEKILIEIHYLLSDLIYFGKYCEIFGLFLKKS
jgi:hypothetical protein